jgi:hypothetical protein
MSTAHDRIRTSEIIDASAFLPLRLGGPVIRGGWRLTRDDLVSRTADDAWEYLDGRRLRLKSEPAAILAEDLNAVRPWEGG